MDEGVYHEKLACVIMQAKKYSWSPASWRHSRYSDVVPLKAGEDEGPITQTDRKQRGQIPSSSAEAGESKSECWIIV